MQPMQLESPISPDFSWIVELLQILFKNYLVNIAMSVNHWYSIVVEQ